MIKINMEITGEDAKELLEVLFESAKIIGIDEHIRLEKSDKIPI